jgi:hypothetical protein
MAIRVNESSPSAPPEPLPLFFFGGMLSLLFSTGLYLPSLLLMRQSVAARNQSKHSIQQRKYYNSFNATSGDGFCEGVVKV